MKVDKMSLETKNTLEIGPKWANLDLKKVFDDYNHQYQLEIIVYHDMQNEKTYE